MQLLSIIPARGGSKDVPRKNIRQLAGKPLITWTIDTALSCKVIDRVVVSTDDQEIAGIAQHYGAEVPFIQPAELAQDNVTDFPVCQFALNWLADNENYSPDVVVWLRPTTPLRRIRDIEAAVNILIESGADCVRSVSIVGKKHPYWMKKLDGDRLLPFMDGIDEQKYSQRQLLPPVYHLNGAVDVTWTLNVIEHGFLFGRDMRAYIMDPELSLDLDTEFDFALAELLMQRRINGSSG